MAEDFRFELALEVRFRDLDALGHVNHATFLTYFEEARTAYWMKLTGTRNRTALDFILARVECDYRTSLEFPETVRVGVRCSRIGGKSFDLEYRILRADGAVAALGRTVQVGYDYASGQSRPISEHARRLLTEFEGRDLVGSGGPSSEPSTSKPRERI
jgi:acyl-CoA thioester hydrolase